MNWIEGQLDKFGCEDEVSGYLALIHQLVVNQAPIVFNSFPIFALLAHVALRQKFLKLGGFQLLSGILPRREFYGNSIPSEFLLLYRKLRLPKLKQQMVEFILLKFESFSTFPSLFKRPLTGRFYPR
jgi:hypothetical protein